MDPSKFGKKLLTPMLLFDYRHLLSLTVHSLHCSTAKD